MTEPDSTKTASGDEVDIGVAADPPGHRAKPDTESPGTTRADDQDELAALVLRIVHQDESALGDLYRRLSSRVFRKASRLVHHIGTAEEVVEDVFWQVWRQAPRFDPGRGTVTAWVMQIARSRALDALRASGRNPLLQALALDDEIHLAAAEEEGPPGLLDRAKVGERVEGALALLDPLRRQLVSLSFERGYSQLEIAEQMGLPLGTVKSHIRRALAAMKTTLEGTPSTAPERPA